MPAVAVIPVAATIRSSFSRMTITPPAVEAASDASSVFRPRPVRAVTVAASPFTRPLVDPRPSSCPPTANVIRLPTPPASMPAAPICAESVSVIVIVPGAVVPVILAARLPALVSAAIVVSAVRLTSPPPAIFP